MVNRLELAEFKLKNGDFELLIRTKSFAKSDKNTGQGMPMMVGAPAVSIAPTAPVPEAPPAATSANAGDSDVAGEDAVSASDANLVAVKSPIVGTFYRSSSPDKEAFVKVGDTIDVGSVVCIVEAMKLFNEIESEVSGKIVKVMLEDASPVQYEQVLFMVDPNG